MMRILCRKFIVTVLMVLFLTQTAAPSYSLSKTTDYPYDDLVLNDIYTEDILYLTNQGVLNGTKPGKFSPSQNTTREMLVTALGRVAEELGAAIHGEENVFPDIVPNTWYSRYVSWAASIGIVRGYPDSTFGVNKPVTREEAAVIIARYADYLGLQLPDYNYDFEDSRDRDKICGWAYEYVERLSCSGILRLDAEFFSHVSEQDGKLVQADGYYYDVSPHRAVKRCEMASLIAVLMKMVN